MYTIFAVTVISIVILYFISKKFWKKDLTGELIIGFFLGLFWEILTNEAWNYDVSRMITLYVGKAEIPLEIVMGWSFVLATSVLATELMQKKLKWHGKVSFFVLGIVSIFLIGFATEVIGINTNVWTYPDNRGVYQFGPVLLPLRVAFGWMFFGVIFLTTIKYYHHVIESELEGDITNLIRRIARRRR